MTLRTEAREIAIKGLLAEQRRIEFLRQVPSVDEVQEAGREAQREAFRTGRLSRDELEESFIIDTGRLAYESVTEAGKHLLRKVLQGQAPLPDIMEDAILPIGEGGVLSLRSFDLVAFFQWDRTRYSKLREEQESYADGRALFDKAVPILQANPGLTFGEVVTRGLMQWP